MILQIQLRSKNSIPSQGQTIRIKDDHVPPGSHYHRIDLRGEE